MIANLIFTALCLGLVLIVSSDLHSAAPAPRRVRVRHDDLGRPGRN